MFGRRTSPAGAAANAEPPDINVRKRKTRSLRIGAAANVPTTPGASSRETPEAIRRQSHIHPGFRHLRRWSRPSDSRGYSASPSRKVIARTRPRRNRARMVAQWGRGRNRVRDFRPAGRRASTFHRYARGWAFFSPHFVMECGLLLSRGKGPPFSSTPRGSGRCSNARSPGRRRLRSRWSPGVILPQRLCRPWDRRPKIRVSPAFESAVPRGTDVFLQTAACGEPRSDRRTILP